MSSEKKFPAGCWLGLLVGVGATVLIPIGFFVLLAIFGMMFSDLEPGPKIAQIDIEGLITSSAATDLFGVSGDSMVDRAKKALKQALESDDVKAIVLRINSPGGEVTASDTIYHAVKKAAEKKPVVIFMDSLAASGGYYIACGGSEIMANDTTLTGSIGVIIQTLNYQELLGKVGLRYHVFKSGKFKDLLRGSREMTPEEEALVQGMVMEMYDKFVGIVSASRDLPEAKLRQDIADGRIFSGAKAKEAGLVDETGYLEDAHERARKLGKAPDAKVRKIHPATGFFEAFGLARSALAAGSSRRVEIDVSERLWPKLQPGQLYLLPAHYAE